MLVLGVRYRTKLFDLRACRAYGCNECFLGRRHRIETDQKQPSGKSSVPGCNCGRQRLGKLCGGNVLTAPAEAFECVGPAGEGACVGRTGGSVETASASVGAEPTPCVRSKLGQRVNGAQREGSRIGGDNGPPERMLLRGVQEELCCMAFEQQAAPLQGEP